MFNTPQTPEKQQDLANLSNLSKAKQYEQLSQQMERLERNVSWFKQQVGVATIQAKSTTLLTCTHAAM